MKIKQIGYLGLIVLSGLILSACTNKQTTNTDIGDVNNDQVQQEADNPSGTPNGRAQGQQMMDLAAAAEKIGVTEEDLRSALGMDDMAQVTPGLETTPGARLSGQPKQMDLAAAAKILGVTEDALKEALGMDNMPSGAPQGGERQGVSESAPVDEE